ncbi:MAG: mannose-6-phosphate isomerase, class I [Lachnospiraceae bacterium]|nr:mannose-6-phosphate isomerase, class I [Lachnospiraceae bacterium]
MDILFLEPVFKEMVWGGSRLKDFGYDIPTDKTGECWAVSAHPHGDCLIQNGIYKGWRLSRLWEEHRELFGNMEGDKFPLLIKIIDAKEDLSIQVHPDDHYAREHENGSLGKTECWYILDCDENATIIIGHHAKDKAEVKEMIEQKRWTEFLREIPVKKGDFFQIEPGTLHAIKGGTLILETQQNSDITYRVYDYDRKHEGSLRPLHLKQSMDVLEAPYIRKSQNNTESNLEGVGITCLENCQYYTVWKIDITDKTEFKAPYPFMILSVVEGAGEINNTPIKKGDHFILPCAYGAVTLSGKMKLIASIP